MPEQPKKRRDASGQDPMDEENFPTRSPTRDAVEREMQEPSNVRGPAHPTPTRRPPLHDVEPEPREAAESKDDGGPEGTTH